MDCDAIFAPGSVSFAPASGSGPSLDSCPESELLLTSVYPVPVTKVEACHAPFIISLKYR